MMNRIFRIEEMDFRDRRLKAPRVAPSKLEPSEFQYICFILSILLILSGPTALYPCFLCSWFPD